ncbi:unnamed protein product [Prorocentrum cordatum]|uniref:Autophagy-related protein n=1 Tax=Prorocentrum cordatum TaxID=2364126 RepID=A0ABN9PQV1_9DINO|nr:unnamed protein product [Polarella glacialis]
MPYANESPAALRQKHPSRVPVVCRSAGGGQTLRLLVPKGMDGEGFKDAVSKHRSFPAGLLVVGGQPLRKSDDFGTLDSRYGHPQGCLEVLCHSRPAASEAADSSSVRAAAGSEAGSSEEGRPATAASSEAPAAAAQPRPPPRARRRASTPEAARKLLRRHPSRVPVICSRAPAADGGAAAELPRGARKMLAPRGMLCGELRDVICRQLAAHEGGVGGTGQADLVAGGTRLEPGTKVADAFDRHRAEDGLLYVSLAPPAAPPPRGPSAAVLVVLPQGEVARAGGAAGARGEAEAEAAPVAEEACKEAAPVQDAAEEEQAPQEAEQPARGPGAQPEQFFIEDGNAMPSAEEEGAPSVSDEEPASAEEAAAEPEGPRGGAAGARGGGEGAVSGGGEAARERGRRAEAEESGARRRPRGACGSAARRSRSSWRPRSCTRA